MSNSIFKHISASPFGRLGVGLFLLVLSLTANAANKKTTVAQVTEPVTVTDDVDYTITSETPFADGGSVNIANTEHATVILNAVKPSAAIRLLANYVTIDGKKAVNNTNCQVKIYNRGAIILPYPSKQMLTVYSEPNFGGTAVSEFGTESNSGFMNTLTDAKLNNRIRSFKLKRGYMVTFSTLPRGRGYSRCFIAANADLEVPELPAVLDSRISSYRVFKWYDTGKQQLAAAGGDKNACSALNVTSTYSWNQGADMLPDVECVSHHIYEDYPSPGACGNVNYTPHMKTNNEPRNSSDDHPQDLATILANWENLMATGMRLCSPSSWDGSDYWNGTGFLKEFFDSIDARGWRCDIVDMHCYWPEGNFPNLQNWYNAVHRPVWISEWVWGASWNNNGAFASGVTEAQNASALKRICATLNGFSYVERYYYWNGERDPSRLYKNGSLTEAGKYYATINSGVGYSGKHDFIPTTPPQHAPSGFSVSVADGKATIKWHDANGEYNQLMELQIKQRGGQWQVLATIDQKETASDYTYTDEQAPEGAQYRLHLVDLNGNSHYSSYDLTPGDEVKNADGETRYVGGNMLANGDFDLGTLGWTTGTGASIGQPHFQVVPVGGFGGGSYLQAYSNGGANAAGALKTYIPINPGTEYLFRCASRNAGVNQRLYVTTDEKSTGTEVVKFADSPEWLMQSASFNSGSNSYALIAFRQLQAKGQMDKMELRPLFKSREEAVADGLVQLKNRAQAVMAYNANPVLAALNTELQQRMDAITTVGDEAIAEAETAINDLLQAIDDYAALDSIGYTVEALMQTGVKLPDVFYFLGMVGPEHYTAQYISSRYMERRQALDEFLTYTDSEVQPQSPSFADTKGWEVKVGTHTAGDQRTNKYGGKNCWNAWWSGINATEGAKKSMEIRQKVESLPEGLYALECKASTQHYCLSDQHGYLVYEGDTLATPQLTADYMDLPTVPDIWQTLTTPPFYVSEGGSVTIGFLGTKQGAVNNAWHAFGDAANTGDRREGWWCATDFRLLYHPLVKLQTAIGQWGTLCLPYAAVLPGEAKFYQIAGILPDQSRVCIEEVTQIEAGRPVIYLSEAQSLTFTEYGEKAKSPLSYSKANNLRGYFATSAAIKAPVGSYMLNPDGTWVKVEDTRPSIPSFSAIIFKLDGIPELDTWDGLSMPLYDSSQTAILTPAADRQPTRSYTVSGQPTDNARGVVIEQQGNETRKVMRRR